MALITSKCFTEPVLVALKGVEEARRNFPGCRFDEIWITHKKQLVDYVPKKYGDYYHVGLVLGRGAHNVARDKLWETGRVITDLGKRHGFIISAAKEQKPHRSHNPAIHGLPYSA